MAPNPQVFILDCQVKNYEWGNFASDSIVASLKKSADPSYEITSEKKYAELWMGTHPNCPSTVIRPGMEDMPLIDWICENPDSLGEQVRTCFNGTLPFLFKVLSVRTSLSIQAHPNKVHAEKLHKERPDLYKDSNHKPELAIALTPFKGLCGFRPIAEVAQYILNIEELRNSVGVKEAMRLVTNSCSMTQPLHRESMKACFSNLMDLRRDDCKKQLKSLVHRINNMKARNEDLTPVLGDLILKLDHEFPGDPGAFCVYFLNLVCLEKGEAMFLDANLPHAYLSGDCMECMACSDNVVRAGLTPKYIDKHTLVEMLDYTGRSVAHRKFPGIEDVIEVPEYALVQPQCQLCPNDGEHEEERLYCPDCKPSVVKEVCCTIFRPPVPDFGVTKYSVPSGVTDFQLNAMESASICIIIEGYGMVSNRTLLEPLDLHRGTVFFLSAYQQVAICISSLDRGMELFRTYAGHLVP